MTGLQLLAARWAPEILLALDPGPRNFNRLLEIPGISDRMLTERLRTLERAELVSRQVVVQSPIRVMYGLTVAGRRYVRPLAALNAIDQPEVAAIA